MAATAGVVSSLAFDPVAAPFAMLVALAVLIAVLRAVPDVSWRGVVLVGLAFGLGFMVPLVVWMRAVSDGAYVGLAVGEAVLVMVVVLVMRAVATAPGWPVWTAAAWTAGEVLRGGFPFTGFPWGRLAHTAIDTPFEAWVRVLGMTGLTFLMALTAAGLVVLATGPGGRHRAGAAVTVAASVAVGALLPTGLASPAGTRQVAIVQGGVPGEFLDWPRGEIFTLHADATERLVDRVATGESPAPDFVLWPENSTDIDPNFDRRVRERIEQLADDLDAPILVGGIFDGPTVDTSYNAGVVWTADGPGDRYVKRKPVAYGEYVPFRSSLGSLVPRIDRDIPRDMLAGETSGALDIGNTRIGDTICYDIAYDGVVRDAVDDGAQLIVVQTSNAAFSNTAQPEQQWDISRLRAIETGRFVLVPSTNGISGVVDATGTSVQRAPYDTPTVIDAEVTLASGLTPAVRWGGWIEAAIVLTALAGWAMAIVRRRDAGAVPA
ncbi:apolipoprotein N-acyltransferase [Aeromicrobium marinum DSM 15272]|uniref:Apolipoprotein N-acyltransferase n=1 Tax=Aeromicrobium marinum DSM 15272 TaxID=585531 RepID=E2S9U7_9ACTN|nr:apolipoprotein N-acyltransferase [Aeromicrobium marinum DSM 15272]